jgi:hypothetical protein
MKVPIPGTAEAVTAQERAAKRAHPVVIMLVVTVLAYGLLLSQMGFYWDELPMSWIRYELGPEAMTRYFSTNRPIWGMLYQLTTHVLPQIPIYWETFALVLRWGSAVLVWMIAKDLWPGHRQFALIAGLAFLLYPGFNQQWTSYLYSHFFIVLCFLLLSFLCSLAAARKSALRIPLTLAGLVLSALNLWMMEYFFVLELLRPLLLLRVGTLANPGESHSRALLRAALAWIPYLLVFVANVLWRLLVFNNQVYQPTSLLAAMKMNPITAGVELVQAIGLQLFRTGVAAWGQVFQFPSIALSGPRTLVFYAVVTVLTAAIVAVGLIVSRRIDLHPVSGRWWPVWMGLAAMLLAGCPFILTGLEVTLAYPANRFTLPFMLGVSLVLAGLSTFASPSIRMWLAVALFSLAAGRQALWAEAYRHDWATHKEMFWQMAWRAPGIAPNTILFLNEGALPYYADNSLTGALNWIYDPHNRSGNMDYVLFYPTSRVGGALPSLQAGQPIEYDFISEVFTGSTSKVLSFFYLPPGCLRLLDPSFDTVNHLIPDASMMREAAALSSVKWVLEDTEAHMPDIYGPEPAHGWCFFFERAGLAAQRGDWDEVTKLGDQAFRIDDYPNDPVERFVFIEGYAHTNAWKRAAELSDESYRVSRSYVGPLLCRLWRRIEAETVPAPEREETLSRIKRMYTCTNE